MNHVEARIKYEMLCLFVEYVDKNVVYFNFGEVAEFV